MKKIFALSILFLLFVGVAYGQKLLTPTKSADSNKKAVNSSAAVKKAAPLPTASSRPVRPANVERKSAGTINNKTVQVPINRLVPSGQGRSVVRYNTSTNENRNNGDTGESPRPERTTKRKVFGTLGAILVLGSAHYYAEKLADKIEGKDDH